VRSGGEGDLDRAGAARLDPELLAARSRVADRKLAGRRACEADGGEHEVGGARFRHRDALGPAAVAELELAELERVRLDRELSLPAASAAELGAAGGLRGARCPPPRRAA